MQGARKTWVEWQHWMKRSTKLLQEMQEDPEAGHPPARPGLLPALPSGASPWCKGITHSVEGRCSVCGPLTRGGNLQFPADTPLYEQPCEPDGDPFRECTQIFEPAQEGEYWSNAHMECQLQHLAIPLLKPGGQDIKLHFLMITLQTIQLFLRMPLV